MNTNLTLAITTFNRPKAITRLISHITEYNNKYDLAISAVIVDASSDALACISSKFIKYIHAPSISMTDGFFLAASNVVTPYTQFFCDDDSFLMSGMTSLSQTLHDEVRHKTYRSFVLQSCETDSTRQLTLRTSLPLKINTNVRVSSLSSKDTFAVLDYMTYIGCLVVPTNSLSLSLPACPYFPHISWYLSVNSISSVYVIAQPVISITAGQASWRHNTLKIFNYYWPLSLEQLSTSTNPEIYPYLRYLKNHSINRYLYYLGSYVLPVNYSQHLFHRLISCCIFPVQAILWFYLFLLSITRNDPKLLYEILRATSLSDVLLAKIVSKLTYPQ